MEIIFRISYHHILLPWISHWNYRQKCTISREDIDHSMKHIVLILIICLWMLIMSFRRGRRGYDSCTPTFVRPFFNPFIDPSLVVPKPEQSHCLASKVAKILWSIIPSVLSKKRKKRSSEDRYLAFYSQKK